MRRRRRRHWHAPAAHRRSHHRKPTCRLWRCGNPPEAWRGMGHQTFIEAHSAGYCGGYDPRFPGGRHWQLCESDWPKASSLTVNLARRPTQAGQTSARFSVARKAAFRFQRGLRVPTAPGPIAVAAQQPEPPLASSLNAPGPGAAVHMRSRSSSDGPQLGGMPPAVSR
jgi:hypothetical protein